MSNIIEFHFMDENITKSNEEKNKYRSKFNNLRGRNVGYGKEE